MSFFHAFFSQTPPNVQAFGLAENEDYYCIVNAQTATPQLFWYPKPMDLPTLVATFNATFKKKKNNARSKWIRPIPSAYIWKKTLPLIQEQDQNALFRLVIQTLKQELPLPIEAVYFDFYCQSEKQTESKSSNQLHLFALRKAFADPYILNLDTILDSEQHCYQRGKDYLLQTQPSITDITEYPFPDTILVPELYVLALGAALWKN